MHAPLVEYQKGAKFCEEANEEENAHSRER
jgi:hypothetical protein